MAGPTETEQRWQDLWERSLQRAVDKGLPQDLAARTMMAAGMKQLAEVEGVERMAFVLGRLAYEFEAVAHSAVESPRPANDQAGTRH